MAVVRRQKLWLEWLGGVGIVVGISGREFTDGSGGRVTSGRDVGMFGTDGIGNNAGLGRVVGSVETGLLLEGGGNVAIGKFGITGKGGSVTLGRVGIPGPACSRMRAATPVWKLESDNARTRHNQAIKLERSHHWAGIKAADDNYLANEVSRQGIDGLK